MPLATPAARIRASLTLLLPQRESLARRFFERLHAAHPDLEGAYPFPSGERIHRFISALSRLAEQAHDLGALDVPLADLGFRLACRDVGPEHYGSARDVLLLTLEEACGPAWSEQLRADWVATLNAASCTMIRAGEAARRRTAA